MGAPDVQSKPVSVFDDGLGPSWKIWRRRRYLVAMLAFFGFMNVYSLRVNLSVAIVAMISPYNVTLANGTIVQMQDFDWDSRQGGLALSSFFYGYIWTQLAGGWLANQIGGGRLFCAGILATSILTLITPPIARASFPLLLTVRIVEGLFEGVTFPCIHAVWAQWAPPLERSRLATIAFSGSSVGTVVAMPLCGLIANTLGWEAIFYIFGAIGVFWCIIWTIVVRDAPRHDAKISKHELDYIETSIGKDSQSSAASHPWKDIIRSKAVWAIVVAHCTENWGFYTLLTQLPSFMNDTLNYKIEKVGFISGLPYLAMAIVMLGSGQLADFLRSRKILSTTAVRKLLNCTAFIAQTIFMLLAAYLTSPTGIIICIVIAVGLGGFAWSGFGVNHLDIAPQHASVLMGFGNTFATLPGILSPLLTGFIVQNRTAAEWTIVFYIAASIYLIGAVTYGFCASGEIQSWAKKSDNEIAVKTPNYEKGRDNLALEPDSKSAIH